jgi:methylated-DNA-[protein]-cysteine S-methyltransferase
MDAASTPTFYSWLESPLGPLLLTSDAGGVLTRVRMRSRGHMTTDPAWRRDDTMLGDARRQLAAYFAGELQRFDLVLALPGTPFQQRVWQALRDLHYGETVSYGELARRIGEAGAARAVGLANHNNPLPIVVPCHRVIGADGSLTGFGGGIGRKRWLLTHEARHASGPHRGDAPLIGDLFAGDRIGA